LMSNIMDKVAEELKSHHNDNRKLSDELIGRIVSLSQTMRPYRYLENDKLIEKPLSPERGQLLYSLVNSFLNDETMDKIFAKADFSYADLQGANLSNTYLRRANLVNSSFPKASFKNAFLEGALFTNANLMGAVFDNATLLNVQFDSACLRHCNFYDVSAISANLSFADMSGSRVSGDFSKVIMDGLQLEDAELGLLSLEGARVKTQQSADRFTEFTTIYEAFIQRNYDWQEVMQTNANGDDSYFRLEKSADYELSTMAECDALVLKIIESNRMIRSLKKEMTMAGEKLEILEEASPFGSSDIGMKNDSVYLFRIVGEEDSAILEPKMIVEFDPNEGTLTQIILGENEQRKPLKFSRSLFKQLKAACKTGK